MTAGYDLSTSWSQHFHQISLVCSRKTLGKPKRKPRKTQKKPKEISVILESCQYAAYHNFSIYPFLFNRSISVVFPVMFPMNFRRISRRISTVYNHGMVLVFG